MAHLSSCHSIDISVLLQMEDVTVLDFSCCGWTQKAKHLGHSTASAEDSGPARNENSGKQPQGGVCVRPYFVHLQNED